MEKINEAAVGNIDKLYQSIDKITSTVNKAQNALLDVADELTDLILSANQIGGKVAQLVPAHLKPHIAALTKMAQTDLQEISDGQGPSSLSNLKSLLGNIPYRDLKPQDTTDVRSQISLQPNLAAGPQSAIKEKTLEEFYKNKLMEDSENYQYNDTVFMFDKLKESEIFGTKYEEDMMSRLNMKLAAPIDTKRVRENIRAKVDMDAFEDSATEPLQEGKLDFSNLGHLGGDELKINLGTLKDGMGSLSMVN